MRSIAVDGIDAFLKGKKELDKRPKVDVHHFDEIRKWLETGHEYNEVQVPILGTSERKDILHNFEDRSAASYHSAQRTVPRPLPGC